MSQKMTTALAALILGTICVSAPSSFASGGGGSSSSSASSSSSKPAATIDFSTGRAAIDRKDWAAAISAFEKVVAQDDRNADAYNWLGYASRKSGKLDAAFKYYDSALAIDPKHRGAHEYLGEAYLMAKNIDKAEEQLATLAKLCNSNCEEYKDLQQALVSYKTTK